ncbi:MAG: InlB B-repeat-containing protein [Treponema sp.]|nr:InlB B-repeat-containing protein [Treponema sp.]
MAFFSKKPFFSFFALILCFFLFAACDVLFLDMAGKAERHPNIQDGEGRTVTFNFNHEGSSAPVTRQVPAGQATLIDFPDEPVWNANYLFRGWFMDDNKTQFSHRTVVSRDMTVFAQWVPLPSGSLIVTFDRNGGAVAPSPSKMAVAIPGAPLRGLPEEPARPGYIFTGWNQNAAGTGDEFGKLTPVSAAITVFAQWATLSADSLIVEFDSNAGDSNASPRSMAVEPGGTLGTLPPDPPLREGYKFTGWKTRADGTGSFFDENTPVNDNITLYAQWEFDGGIWTVKFETNGGSSILDQNVPRGTPVPRPPDPVRTGHVFAGWYSESGFAASSHYNFSEPVTADITLYARWEGTSGGTVTVSFDSNGGTAVTNQSIAVGEKLTKPPVPSRTTTIPGFPWVFSGWFRENGVEWNFENDNVSLPSFTLFARWEIEGQGDGSVGDPFLVYDEVTLRRVGQGTGAWTDDWAMNKYYRQIADVTIAGGSFTPIGSNGDPFTGTYNGRPNGTTYTISNLIINLPSADNVGLFGYINGGTLSNIILTGLSVTGRNNVGGLVGYNSGGTIENSSAAGTVNGGGSVGGLVGFSSGGEIENSRAAVTVTGTASRIGGLVGDNNSLVTDCYATGNVNGINDVGGLVGYTNSTITNTYTAGAVIGTGNNIGGIVGHRNGGTISNSVAINPSVSGGSSADVGRIVGNGGTGGLIDWLINNYGNYHMTITRSGGTSFIDSLRGRDGLGVAADGIVLENPAHPFGPQVLLSTAITGFGAGYFLELGYHRAAWWVRSGGGLSQITSPSNFVGPNFTASPSGAWNIVNGSLPKLAWE